MATQPSTGVCAAHDRLPAGIERLGLGLAADEDGLPRLVFPETFNVARYAIDRHVADGRGARIALRTFARDFSYAELLEQVNRFGNALVSLGAARGDRVLIVSPDRPEFLFLFWGAIKAGLVPVPLNAQARAPEFEFIIQHSRCAAVVYGPELSGEAEKALSASPWQPPIVLRLDGGGDSLAHRAASASPCLDAAPTRADDDCYGLYSSGTTGSPKGVVHAHRSIAACCQLFTVGVLGAREDDTFYSVARLFFSYGLAVIGSGPFWAGATAVLAAERQTPELVVEVLRRFEPTVLAAVPTFYAQLLASGLLRREDAPRLRLGLSAAEAMPAALHRQWSALTGVPILEGLGSTEVGHIYVANRPGDIRPGTTGRPVPGYRVRIVDDDGKDVAAGECGRLLVRGQSVTSGYWNDPDRTARAIVDGWFDTGDSFACDASGSYVFQGRCDDMFKTSGRWVSPIEIEAVALQHPKVLEAAVIARTDPHGLLKPELWVVPTDPGEACGQLAGEILEFARSRLPKHKWPAWIRLVDELPRTASGKIQRYRLRDEPLHAADCPSLP